MTYSALGVPRTQTLPAVTDSVSKVAGNKNGFNYCGSREYSVTAATPSNYVNVLSLDKGTNAFTLGLPQTTQQYVGVYTIEIMLKLTEYPTIIATKTFTVQVTDCVVTSLAKTSVIDQKYNIYTPDTQFSFV